MLHMSDEYARTQNIMLTNRWNEESSTCMSFLVSHCLVYVLWYYRLHYFSTGPYLFRRFCLFSLIAIVSVREIGFLFDVKAMSQVSNDNKILVVPCWTLECSQFVEALVPLTPNANTTLYCVLKSPSSIYPSARGQKFCVTFAGPHFLLAKQLLSDFFSRPTN